jgi:hypothetical protein
MLGGDLDERGTAPGRFTILYVLTDAAAEVSRRLGWIVPGLDGRPILGSTHAIC